MKKTSIKMLSLLVSLAVIVTLFSGFTKTSTPAPIGSIPKDFVTLKVVMPGEESPRMKDFLNTDFKAKLKKDLNLGLDITWIGWDQYWTKKSIMLASGQQIDFYWDGMPLLSGIVAKKEAQPINDLLTKYAYDLRKIIPTDNFKTTTFNNKIMAIPIQYGPTSEKQRSVLVRQDLLEAVGMKTIKTVDDLTKYCKLVKAKYPTISNPIANNINHPLLRQFGNGITTLGADNLAGFPVAYDEINKKAVSLYETDAWKKACKQFDVWSKDGYVSEDVTIKPVDDRMSGGIGVVGEGAISRPMENASSLIKNVPTGRYAEYLLAPEKSNYKASASTEVICIGATAKYPDRAMQLINWIYKSPDNYNMFIYGVKGKDFKIVNNRIVQLTTDSFFYEWMFRNINMMTFPTTVDDNFIKTYKNWDKNSTLSGVFGFQFDTTPVKSEFAKLSSVYTEKILPLETGYVDFDQNYPDALKALKGAGIDKYVKEYQKQLSAYQKSTK